MLDRLGQAALAALLLFVALPGLTVSPAKAQSQIVAGGSADPYSVTGVAVDVTASSAAEARDKAISEAQRKAFEVLFKRLVAEGPGRVVPAVGESDLQRMIQGFEIEQERGSAVRYVASMAFKFRAKAVNTYVTSLGLHLNDVAQAVATTPAATPATAPAPAIATVAAVKPTLVLPLAQGGAAALPWEERTPWRTAWEDYAAAAGAGRILVPAGELTDVADIGAKEAIGGDAASIAKIAGHYNAGLVVVAALAGADRLDPAAGGQVLVSRYGADGLPVGAGETVAVQATLGEPVTAFLTRAAAAVADTLKAAPATPAVPAAVATDVPVVAGAPITGMADWLEVRRRLTSDPMVTSVELLAMSRSRVDVAIHYRGDVEGLRAMLERDGLTLVPTPGGWSLFIKASVVPSVPVASSAPAAAQPAAQASSSSVPAPVPVPAQAPTPKP